MAKGREKTPQFFRTFRVFGGHSDLISGSLTDGQLIAGSRGFGKTGADTHIVLSRMIANHLDPILKFPSVGGACGYTDLLWHSGILWVAYNATINGKTNVFLAKVRI